MIEEVNFLDPLKEPVEMLRGDLQILMQLKLGELSK